MILSSRVSQACALRLPSFSLLTPICSLVLYPCEEKSTLPANAFERQVLKGIILAAASKRAAILWEGEDCGRLAKNCAEAWLLWRAALSKL